MNNKVFDIWTQLETQKEMGLVKRLYYSKSDINIYCIYQYPDDCYGIALSYPSSIKLNIAPFKDLREPIVSQYNDSSFPENSLLCAKIQGRKKINEFSYLCENVIQSICDEREISNAVKTFVNALLRWKNLFQRVQDAGLSVEEQLGLFGEMSFLNKLVSATTVSYYDIIQYYVGAEQALRDFQGCNWAVEVKTTATNNPQTLLINGERQLDDTKIEKLFLYHCSVEVSRSTGVSLSDLVRQIIAKVESDVAAVSLLNCKLFEAGYLFEQAYLYDDRCYQVRKDNFYLVKDNFPRIREDELRDGVGNVKYSISVSSLESYNVSEEYVISNCLSND